MKKKQYEAEGAKEFREENKRIQKEVQKEKEDWIGNQCKKNENCLDKSNRAYKQVRDLTSDKQGRSLTIQAGLEKSDQRTRDSQQMEEYCSELNSHDSCGYYAVLGPQL